MMNDEMEPFEGRLRQQSLKEIPPDWRSEILTAASTASMQNKGHRTDTAFRPNWLSTINYQLSTLLWPHPKAWAGLAAVWVFILVLNFSTRDSAPRMTEKSAPTSSEMIAEAKTQQRLLAELTGTHERMDVDRQKLFAPRPRSKYSDTMMT